MRRARRPPVELEEDVVDVAPEPVLTRFERLHQRVAGTPGVGGGVLVGRRVAAPDVPALDTAAQVHPAPAGRQALDAAVAARRHGGLDVGQVRALVAHGRPPYRRARAAPVTGAGWP